MKHFFTLYKSELRRNRIFALLMFFAHFRLFVYSMTVVELTSIEVDEKGSFVFYLFLTVLGSLPLILFYSFVPGQTFNTKHLVFPLPVTRATFITAKYLALVSMVLYVILGYFLLGALPLAYYSGIQQYLFPHPGWFFIYLSKAGYIGIINFFSPIALMAGLVCVAESLHHAIKRYTSVARFVFLMGSLLGTLWTMKYLASYLYVFPELYTRDTYEAYEKILIYFHTTVSAYVVVVGLLFLLMGMYIYERFADV